MEVVTWMRIRVAKIDPLTDTDVMFGKKDVNSIVKHLLFLLFNFYFFCPSVASGRVSLIK